MHMKKRAIIFVWLLIASSPLFAQKPVWKPNEPAYQYTMTIVAKLNVDRLQLTNQNDLVGAFVGNTCRGVSELTYVASTKSYYAYLTVFSNTAGEKITFHLYNSVSNKITIVSKTINFVPSQHLGNLVQSYSIAEPALNDKAEIISFDFLNIKSLTSSIAPGLVNINISESFPLNNLKPVFVLSVGARLFKNGVLQNSGTTADSYLVPAKYDVLSEDESALTSYTVKVTQSLDPPLFYKKDVVCSTLGAIRVVSKREGAIVKLTYEGNLVDSKLVTNGQAIFADLLAGTYVATIENEFKVIVIKRK